MNLHTLSDVLPNKFVTFGIPFLYYAKNNLKSSIICCLFSGGIIISSGSFISFSFSLFFDLPNEVIVSAILFPIKSPVASALF